MPENKQLTKERNQARAELNRARLGVIKVEKGCTDCGYNVSPHALEFDHLPEFKKSRTVASLCWAAWERIMEEVNKCEVVCANCHAIRTAKRANWK